MLNLINQNLLKIDRILFKYVDSTVYQKHNNSMGPTIFDISSAAHKLSKDVARILPTSLLEMMNCSPFRNFDFIIKLKRIMNMKEIVCMLSFNMLTYQLINV